MSSAGPSGWPSGTVCQPKRPRATDSGSTRRKSRRPTCRGSSTTAGPIGPARRRERRRTAPRTRRGPGRVDVADDHQDRPFGPVMVAVERLEVGHLDPLQVVGPAQDRVPVGVADVAGDEVLVVEPGEGRLLVAGPLLGDHLPLGLDLGRVEGRPAHPVGLDRQGQLPAVGGEGEPVMGAVLAGLGVGLAGRDEGQAVDLPLGEPLGPLEEHVLDEVGQAGLARRARRTSRPGSTGRRRPPGHAAGAGPAP